MNAHGRVAEGKIKTSIETDIGNPCPDIGQNGQIGQDDIHAAEQSEHPQEQDDIDLMISDPDYARPVQKRTY
jgi:hypothetical protein